ncbi:MAG: hypothetical protein JRI68_06955 [Deltaproteobacteria bacterium]|nr:hypothetical protein [Deltaproteobacteria bacterium]
MAYRERTTDDRWTVPHSKVPERKLPKDCHLAFDVFEKLLETRIQERPAYLESPHDEVTEVFFPNYDHVAPSLAVAAGGCGCMSFLIVSATGAAAWAARSLLNDEVMWWTFGIGGALLLVALIWWWGSEFRERRRIRALPRPPAYGVYLLADAVVDRWGAGCAYFPRRSIVEVFEDSYSTRNVTRYTPSIRYVNAKGAEATHGLADSTYDEEGPITAQARRWFAETEPDMLDAG